MDGLLVGRFQPFHLGHAAAVRFALGAASRLWVGIGSSNRPPSPDNPFSAAEREEMIRSSLGGPELARVRAYRVPDFGDHSAWLECLRRTVPPHGAVFSNDPDTARLCGAGGAVRAVRIPLVRRSELSGTAIRGMILRGDPGWERLVPGGTRRVLLSLGAAARLRGVQL